MTTQLTRLDIALSLATMVAVSVLPIFGQQTTTPAPVTTTPPGNTNIPTNPGRGNIPGTQNPTTRDPNDQMNRFPEQARPIFLSGKVMLDSGTPPPDSVVIERVCNGNPRAEAYTDSKGRFSFQLGQNQGVLQDASMSSAGGGGFGGLGNQGGFGGNQSDMGSLGGFGGSRGGISERDLMGCEIRANLPGFRSDVVNLSGRRAFDNPDIGTIILHRLGNVEGVTISATSLHAPKDAKKSYEKGRDFLRKKKIPEAEKELEKAVQLYPKYAVAWYELGRIRESRNEVEGARKAYGEALAADVKFVKPYHQLAGLSLKEQKWQDVADTTSRLIKLDPVDYADAYFYNSVANYYLKNFDAAEKSAREAQKLDTRNQIPKTNQLLGVILAEKQDFVGAAESMKKYLTFLQPGKEADTVKNQLIELEKMTAAPAPPAQENQ